jgi:hypothetical protein
LDLVMAAAAGSPMVSGGGPTPRGLHPSQLTRVVVMLDFLMIACGVGFFVVAILYVAACEKM